MAGELGEWVLVEGVGRADLRKPSWRRKLSPTASMSASFQHWGSRRLLG